jgi:hypothetical protein
MRYYQENGKWVLVVGDQEFMGKTKKAARKLAFRTLS